jgi:hypothetical protein
VDNSKIFYKFGFYFKMNKTLFLFLTLALVLTSCNQKKSNNFNDNEAKVNNVSVIIDEELWNGEIGDSIRNKFASPVIGLQEEEPIFTLNQYPVKLFEGFMTNSRNILVIKKEAKSKFYVKQNEYTTPQIAVHISGKNVQEILDTIEANAPKIIKDIKDSEVAIFQKRIIRNSLEKDKIKSRFNILINIPSKYAIVLQGKKFLWLKKEIVTGNISLLIYQAPLNRLKDTTILVNSIVKIRDSIGKKYIHGNKPRTKMMTESAFAPYLTKIQVYGKLAYETKGNWELSNDFMSGPFVNYAIVDKTYNRVLFLEGFCYAPSKDKRDLMLELEAIIKSVRFLKKQE